MHVKSSTRIAAVAAALAALALGAPLAGADTTWTKISTDYNANIVVPSLGLTGSTAVVAWTQETSPSTSDLNAVSFTTSPTEDVIGAVQSKVADGVGADRLHPRALPGARWRPAADLQRHPLDHHGRPAERDGDDAAQRRRQLGGALRRVGRQLRSRRPACSRARPRSSRATRTQGIEIFNAAVAHAPGASDQNLQPQLGGCCGYLPRMALDSAGHLWIAWYSNATGATGDVRAAARPRRPARPWARPRWRPNSESSNNNSFGAAPGVRGDLSRSSTATRPRPARPTRSSPGGPGRRADDDRQPRRRPGRAAAASLTAAYRADGRLWVAWFDGKTYRATLGDASGAGGEVQDAGAPKGTGGGAYALERHRRRRQPPAGRELRLGRRPRSSRSRSS